MNDSNKNVQRMRAVKTDVRIVNEGTVFLVEMLTPEAHEWVKENVPNLEGWQFMGANAFAVDARYILELREGMLDAGLEVF